MFEILEHLRYGSGLCILLYYIHVLGVFKDPLAGEYKFSAPQLVMKVKSPPQITGEKTGTMGALTILVWVGRYQSKVTYS